MATSRDRSLKSVGRVIRDALSRDFTEVKIVDVDVVERETDSDGNEFLRIDVIYEGKVEDLDTRKVVSAVRLLRPKLDKIDEFAFPLLSFISAEDAAERSKLAAR